MPANGPRILRNHVDNGAGGEVGDGDDNVDGAGGGDGGGGEDVDERS